MSVSSSTEGDKLVRILRERNRALTNTIEELKKEKDVANRNMVETERMCRDLEQLCFDNEKDMKAQADKYAWIEKEFKGQVDALRRREEELTGQVEALRRQKDEGQLKAAKKREEQLNSEIDELHRKEEEFKGLINVARRREEQLNAKVEAYCRQDEMYQFQLDSFQRAEDELKGEVGALRCQEEELQEQIESFRRQEDKLRTQIDAYRRQEQEMKGEIESLRRSEEDLKMQIKTSSSTPRNGDKEAEKKNEDLTAWADQLEKRENDLSALQEDLMNAAAAVEKAVQTRLDHEKMEAELDRRQKDISEQWNCLKEEAKFLDIRTLQVEVGLKEILQAKEKLNKHDFACCRPDHVATLMKNSVCQPLLNRIIEMSANQKNNVETITQLKKLVEENVGKIPADTGAKPFPLKSQDVVDDAAKVRQVVAAAAIVPPPLMATKQQPTFIPPTPHVPPTIQDSTKEKVLNYLSKNGSLNRPEKPKVAAAPPPQPRPVSGRVDEKKNPVFFKPPPPHLSGRVDEKKSFVAFKPPPPRPGSSAFNTPQVADDEWEESRIPEVASGGKQQPHGKRAPAQTLKSQLNEEEWD